MRLLAIAACVMFSPLLLAGEPVFGTRQAASAQSAVAGRVFLDLDGDGTFTNVDRGLSGARLFLDEATEIICDKEGKYHIGAVEIGFDSLSAHMLALDAFSIPAGVRVKDGRRRIFHLAPLGTVTIDFALVPEQPKEAREARLELDGNSAVHLQARAQSLVAVVKLSSQPDCRIHAPGASYRNEAATLEVELGQPVNQVLVAQDCREEGLFLWSLAVHLVSRQEGGKLVVAEQPRLLAVCNSIGELRRKENGLLNCRLQPQVDLELEGERLAEGVYFLPVQMGSAQLKLRAVRHGYRLQGVLELNNSPLAAGGLLLGRTTLSLAGDASLYFSGGALGRLEAWWAGDFHLFMGANLFSAGQPGYGAADVFMPYRLVSAQGRSPDPEEGYFLFGDEAKVIDANPARSRYVLKLERLGSEIGYGGFRASFQGAGIAGWQRALQGAFLSVDVAEQIAGRRLEDISARLEGFFSRPQDDRLMQDNAASVPASLSTHDELLSTGGTLYLLSHPWAVEGSVRVRVEVRDSRTGLVLSRRELVEHRDYEVDHEAGRILLVQPLAQTGRPAVSPEASPFSRDWTVLVVDYRRLGADGDALPGELAGGALKLQGRPARHVLLGGEFNVVQQGMESADYRRLSGSVSATVGDFSFWVGYARSEGLGEAAGFSGDGGLWFFRQALPDQRRGEAYQSGARFSGDWLTAQLQWRRWLAGYADDGGWAVGDTDQGLLSFELSPWRWLRARGRFAANRQQGFASAGADASGTLADGSLEFEFSPLRELSFSLGGLLEDADGRYGEGQRLTAGGAMNYRLLSWLSLFARYQHTLLRGEIGLPASSATFASGGGQLYQDGWRLGVEGGWGPELGNLLSLDLGREQEETSTFSRASFSPDGNGQTALRLATGQTSLAPYGASITTAQVFESAPGTLARGQQVGTAVPLGKGFRLDVSYQRSELEKAGSAPAGKWLLQPWSDRGLLEVSLPGRRNSVFGRLLWAAKTLALETTGELRTDEWLPLPQTLGADHLRQVVLGLAGRWLVIDGLELGARALWSQTMGAPGKNPSPGGLQAHFMEASFGLAWRPQRPSWLWLLARCSAGEDARPQELRDPLLPLRPAGWISASLALDMRPWSYFQPAFSVSPWLRRMKLLEQDGYRMRWQEGVLGVARLGAEIAWGFGLAAEGRGGYSSAGWSAPALTAGSEHRLGWAAELFYRLEEDNIAQVRIGLGYNFSDMPDPLLQDPALGTGRRGFFVRLEGAL